jgi:hypothetical protein
MIAANASLTRQDLFDLEQQRQLHEQANQAVRDQQAAVNRGLNLINPPSMFCLPFQRGQGMC